jgi:hypothetical protein
MKDSPFAKYPAGFRPLFDRLPDPDDGGNIALEGHWWRKDRDSIALAIGKLGRELLHVQRDLDKAREADDIDAVRKAIGDALIEIQEALMPIYGADLMWPISQAIHVFDCAYAHKRHPLTALKEDKRSIRQDDPKRATRRAYGAAALDFFDGRLPKPNKGQIAVSIGEAMGKGGFHVKQQGMMKPPRGRTVQEWLNLHLPGNRKSRRPTSPAAKEVFEKFRKHLEAQQESIPIEEYFDQVLADITRKCRDAFLTP